MSANYEEVKPYLDTGFELIKLRRNSKTPNQKNWRKSKPLTRAQTNAWVEKGHNVGVRLKPGDLVIDVDPRNFEAGIDSLQKLISDFNLDCSSLVKTGGIMPGFHLYFSKPENARIKKSLPNYPGIDFLSDGQYVVSAGSIHPDTGHQYNWINEDLILRSSAPITLVHALNKREVISVPSDDDICSELLAKMLEALEVENFRDEDQWRKLMIACHHATSGAGLPEFLDWSTSDPSYSDHEHLIRTRWNSCTANKAGGITVRTLYKFLIDAGAANLIPARDAQSDFSDGISVNETISVERTANGLVKNTLKTALAIFGREIELSLAHDEFSHTNVFRAKNLPWDKYVGRELTDNTERLCRVMALEAFNVQLSKENTREALLAIAQMRRFNPFTEYLDSLEWDRRPRIDRLFVDYFRAENSEYNRAVSKIFMVAAVRRVKEPGIKFDIVPILEGPQGSGCPSSYKMAQVSARAKRDFAHNVG